MMNEEAEHCERLKSNDSSIEFVVIYGLNERNARLYGEALKDNTAVETLQIATLDGTGVVSQEWGDTANGANHNASVARAIRIAPMSRGPRMSLKENNPLLQFIEKSSKLKSFQLSGIADMTNIDVQNIVGLFVNAASKSRSIQDLYLEEETIPAASLRNLVTYTKTLTKLVLQRVSISGSNDDIRSAMAGFSENESLRELEITGGLEENWIQLFSHLEGHPNIQKILVSGNTWNTPVTEAFSHSIRQFLEKSPSIQIVEFERFLFRALSFEPIANGLRRRKLTLKKVAFRVCNFHTASSAHFESIFTSAANIESLCIGGATKFRIPLDDILLKIISCLPSTSQLQEIDLSMLHSAQKSTLDYAKILGPLMEDSILKSFNIGNSAGSIKTMAGLCESIPKLKGLQEIVMEFSNIRKDSSEIPMILEAFKQNTSLRQIQINLPAVDIQDPAFASKIKRTLDNYSLRNRRVSEWVSWPENVPYAFWPYVYKSEIDIYQEYRRDLLFKTLIVVG